MTQALTMRTPRRPGWGQTVRFILLLASVVLVLIPVYVLLVTSFKGSADADPVSYTHLTLPTIYSV